MNWQLQEAKNRFSEVVKAAVEKGPQTITVRGKDTVVVLSSNQYAKLVKRKEPLSAFFAKSPLRGLGLPEHRMESIPDREFSFDE